MSQAQIYNDTIIAEARANHGAGRLPAPHRSVTCDNPLCGDRVTLDLTLAGDKVKEIAQKTRGCLLTQAAASLIARHGAGLDAAAARSVAGEVERLLRGETVEPAWPKLAMFAPVAAIKSRHECVLLPFHALQQALSQG